MLRIGPNHSEAGAFQTVSSEVSSPQDGAPLAVRPPLLASGDEVQVGVAASGPRARSAASQPIPVPSAGAYPGAVTLG